MLGRQTRGAVNHERHEGHEDHEEDLFLFLPRRSVQLISPSSTRIFFVSFVLFVIFVAGAAIQRPSY